MLTKTNLFGRHEDASTLRQALRPTPGTNSSPASTSSAPVSPASSAANEAKAEVPAKEVPPAKDPVTAASRLVVGPDVKLKGAEITDCDTLIVEGRVEATMDSRTINIAEKGSFCGTVNIDVAEIHGIFEGELTARQQLIIHGTGKVSGKIRYGRIVIAEGGVISGDVRSLGEEPSAALKASQFLSRENDAKVIGTAL